MMISRRQWVFGTAAGLSLAYPVACEPFWLEVTHTPIRCGVKLSQPVRLLHLADLHASFAVPMFEIDHAIELGLEQKPDLICVTGDFISNKNGFIPEHCVQALRRLSAAAPTFAVLGNHDGGQWAVHHRGFKDHRLVEHMLSASGITLLHNKSLVVEVHQTELQLVGVGDLWSNEIDTTAAFTSVRRELPTVLLSHNPDSKDVLYPYPWHLMLSGHTHGGQVLVPFKDPCFAPVVDKRYVAGLGQWRDRQIYVTRGVGNLGGVRFLCRPEVSMLLLEG